MKNLKIITGYEIYPNLRLMGLEAASVYFRFKDEALVPATVQQLQHLDGLIGIYTAVGHIVCVIFTYRNLRDLESKLHMLQALAGDADLRKAYDFEMPLARRPLSRLDWQIIRALRGRALRSFADVGRELKVSTRTVKRRFERMAEEGSFFIIPQLNPSVVPGLIIFDLLFHLSPEAGPDTINNIHKTFNDHLVCTDEPSSRDLGSYAVGLYATSISQVESLRRRGESIRGVSRVDTLILRESIESFTWIDETIDDMIKTASPLQEGIRVLNEPTRMV